MNSFRNKNITVLLISTSYPRNDQDWRARFIADMTEALSRCKNISLKTWFPPGNLSSNVISAALPEESLYLEKLAAAGGIAHILRSQKFRGISWILNLLKNLRAVYQRESNADVMHINWLQNAIPLWGIKTPAVITVLGTDYKLLELPGMIPLLRMVLKQRKSIIAPNAQWMRISLEKHFADIAEIRPIPFGVQNRWFEISRNFPVGIANHWLTVSRVTANKIGPLFEWGKNLSDEKNILHLLGPNQENLSIPGWVSYGGATNPSELLEKWFPTAAGLITLSRHDEGRPQVMLEAMAAGIPVIASDLPAHQDVIMHGKTGWIVKSPEDFRQALDFMSIAENNISMGNAAKQWIKEHIGTWEDCARRYESAYADLTERKSYEK